MPSRRKRETHEVDRLIQKVDQLHSEGMSVNKACQKVGLQTTVYYYRKRKDEALNKQEPTVHQASAPVTPKYSNKNNDELVAEARELERRLHEIKARIAENVIKSF